MTLAIDNRAFLLRITAPEQKDKVFPADIERGNDGIGEAFPSLALMRSGGTEKLRPWA